MNILRKMFGSYSKKELKRVEPITQKVLALEEKYTNMSEEELKNQTTVLKERLANGETTDDILPEAFDKRIGKAVAEAVIKAANETGVSQI